MLIQCMMRQICTIGATLSTHPKFPTTVLACTVNLYRSIVAFQLIYLLNCTYRRATDHSQTGQLLSSVGHSATHFFPYCTHFIHSFLSIHDRAAMHFRHSIYLSSFSPSSLSSSFSVLVIFRLVRGLRPGEAEGEVSMEEAADRTSSVSSEAPYLRS